MDPGGAATYGNLAASLLATGNFRDAGTILAEAQSQKLQTDYLLEVRYWKAFLDNDSKEMEVVLAQASNVPGARQLLLSEQARTEAYFGRFEKSRQLSELAARLMEHDGDKESAASCLAELAVREAEIGYGRKALSHVFHSLQLERSPAVVALATLALARIGDFERARNMAEELNKAHPSDTLIQKYWLPTIRARMELEQRKFSKALETLTIAGPFEFAAPPPLTVTTLYPAYVRGETYLAMGDGERADAEFGKLIDRPGMVLNFPLAALAPLERARAFALSGDRARAHDSYQRFFQLWNGADSDLPLLKQARAEFSKFTQNAASTSKP